MGNTNFIETIAQGAIKGWHDNGILPSLSLAQAILESGWGQSGLAQAVSYTHLTLPTTERV